MNKFSFEERYQFYTNNILNDKLSKKIFTVPEDFLKHQQNMPLYACSGKIWGDDTQTLECPFIVVTDDGYDNYNLPCFQKTRKIKSHSDLSIILKIQKSRHWEPLNFKDINNWSNKKKEIIWRGSPTGNGDRIKICEVYKDKYNVGLTCTWDNIKQYDYLIKKEMSLSQMCEYKYIVSVEGNDKDSGLNWKLNSNSLVLMKEPSVESWLMESYLKPWIHYIPLSQDFSDIEEKFNWCLNNDSRCQEIVKNANQFMNNFKDEEEENKIINKIIKDYCRYVKISI